MQVCRHRRIAAGAVAAAMLAACQPSPEPAPEPPVVAAAPAPAMQGGSLEPSTLIALDLSHDGLPPEPAPRSRGGAFGVGIRPGVAASGISP